MVIGFGGARIIFFGDRGFKGEVGKGVFVVGELVFLGRVSVRVGIFLVIRLGNVVVSTRF